MTDDQDIIRRKAYRKRTKAIPAVNDRVSGGGPVYSKAVGSWRTGVNLGQLHPAVAAKLRRASRCPE